MSRKLFRFPTGKEIAKTLSYQRPETVTHGGFPNQLNSDSMLAFERSGIDGSGGIDHPT
jgi:hypothetical protein